MQVSARIDAPVERVFDVFTDLDGCVERVQAIRRVERLTDGAVGKGTRWRETRAVFKREATETFEITQFEPTRSYTVECRSCGVLWTAVFAFALERVGGATRVDVAMTSKPLTLIARLMSPMSLIFARSMRNAMAQDLADLKRACEAVDERASAPAG